MSLCCLLGHSRFYERAPHPLRSRPHQAHCGLLVRAAGRELVARVETRRCCAGLGKTRTGVQLRNPPAASRNLAGTSEGAAPLGTALPPPLSLSIRCTQVFVESNLGPPQPIWRPSLRALWPGSSLSGATEGRVLIF